MSYLNRLLWARTSLQVSLVVGLLSISATALIWMGGPRTLQIVGVSMDPLPYFTGSLLTAAFAALYIITVGSWLSGARDSTDTEGVRPG